MDLTNNVSIYTPKEITKDIETGMNIASFDYYSGKAYAELKGLQFTTDFKAVFAGVGYIVCCGDVMVKVEETDYPSINRRLI